MRSRTLIPALVLWAASIWAAPTKPSEGRLVLTGMNLASLESGDRAAAKTLFLQTLGEVRQGAYTDLSDSACQSIACAQSILASTGAQKAVWMSVLHLGSTYSVSASLLKSGDSTAEVRRTSVKSVDDLPNSADQLLRALFTGVQVADAGTIDNVTNSENANSPLRRQSLAMNGVVIGALYPFGDSYGRYETATIPGTYSSSYPYSSTPSRDTLKFKHPQQNLNLGYTFWYEFRQNLALDVELKGALPSAVAFQVDVVKFFDKSDISPFVGGGLGMEYVFPDDPDSDSKMNAGPQLNVQAGLMLFRTYDVRALVRGGYQFTFNSDHDNGAYGEVGILYAPSNTASSGSSSGSSWWKWVLGYVVVMSVISAAAK